MVLPVAVALPAIASAASSIIGGLLGASAEKKQMKMQREFAQNAVQWKVQDANKAGIHPLFALGAPTASYQPISTGSMANAVSGMGQDLGRAMDAVRNPEQRATATVAKMEALQLERASLENILLRAQIMRENNVAGQPPAAPGGVVQPPIPGQADMAQPFISPFNDSVVKPPPGSSSGDHLQSQMGESGDWLAFFNWWNGTKVGQNFHKGQQVRPRDDASWMRYIPRINLTNSPGYKKKYYDYIP